MAGNTLISTEGHFWVGAGVGGGPDHRLGTTALKQVFSTFWCSRTPKSDIAAKLYPLVISTTKNCYFCSYSPLRITLCIIVFLQHFVGYLTNLSQLRQNKCLNSLNFFLLGFGVPPANYLRTPRGTRTPG